MILTRPPAIGPEILFKILFRMGLTPPGCGRIALPVMKKLSLLLVAVLATLVPVSASFSEKRLETEKKSAAEKGKLVAFFFEQEYYDPSCPKCIEDVNSNNNAMKKAVPKKHVNLIMIDAGESRGIDKIPQCVQAAMKKAPQIILTDAACEKVIATIEGRPDRKKADEFEKKAAAVTGKK
jgi:hypothetical protein